MVLVQLKYIFSFVIHQLGFTYIYLYITKTETLFLMCACVFIPFPKTISN